MAALLCGGGSVGHVPTVRRHSTPAADDLLEPSSNASPPRVLVASVEHVDELDLVFGPHDRVAAGGGELGGAEGDNAPVAVRSDLRLRVGRWLRTVRPAEVAK